MAPAANLVHTGQEDIDPNLDVWWNVMIEEIEKFQATEKGKNFWGARVIWSDTRSKNREKITQSKSAFRVTIRGNLTNRSQA